MKELLAELAMVENEITRLESQISHLQSQTKKEKEKEKENEKEISHLPTHGLPSLPKKNSKELKEKVSFETKALHFISKAIKGDYNLNDFSIISTTSTDNNKSMNSNSHSKRFPDDNNHYKEKHLQFQDEVETFRTKAAFKKSGGGGGGGFLKSPSPMRQPTPRVSTRNQ